VVVLTGLLLVAGTTTAVAVNPAHVSVSSTSVSDDEPTTGDTITVTPTIRHSGSGSGSFEVTQVSLESEGGTTYDESQRLGTLGSGDTLDVPLAATLRSAGKQKLVVRVRGIKYGADGKWDDIVHVTHPLYMTVSVPSTSTETKPQLSVEADGLTAGVESTVRVTVSNGGDDAVSNLSLGLTGLGAEDRTALRPTLDAGNSTTFEFDVRPSEAGTHSLNATLQYGNGESVAVSEQVEVASLRDGASVYATLAERDGSTVLRYRVTNHGNAPLENVVVSGAALGSSLPTAAIPTVEPGTSATITIDLNERPSGPATVSAAYEVGSTTGQVDQSVRFTEPTQTATATANDSTGTEEPTERSNRESRFTPLSILTGGIVATGSILGYRNWRDR